jgi:hypothetical protein
MTNQIVPFLAYETVKQRIDYDPETGLLTWKVKTGHKRAGKVAGCAHKQNRNYIVVQIDRRTYMAHRIAWLLMTGEHPQEMIDHIDGNSQNNRWSNLRLATNKQNQENQNKINSRNKSGFRGVCYVKGRNKWRACVQHDGVMHYFGEYLTAQDAGDAAKAKRLELYTHNNLDRP